MTTEEIEKLNDAAKSIEIMDERIEWLKSRRSVFSEPIIIRFGIGLNGHDPSDGFKEDSYEDSYIYSHLRAGADLFDKNNLAQISYSQAIYDHIAPALDEMIKDMEERRDALKKYLDDIPNTNMEKIHG